MNHGVIFVHCEERSRFLPAVDRMLHGLMVFAARRRNQLDVVKMISPFGLNLLRILTTLDW